MSASPDPLYSVVEQALLAGHSDHLLTLIAEHRLAPIVLAAESVLNQLPPSHYWKRRCAEATWLAVAQAVNAQNGAHDGS